MTRKKAPSEGTPPDALCAQLLVYLCAELIDGEWHSWEDVVHTLTPRVPRSRAARTGTREWERIYLYRHGKMPPPREPNSEALIRSGARTWIAWTVYGSKRWFEKVGPRGKQQIRMLDVPKHIRDYVDPMKK